ncbi:MAG: hypothetical protein AAGF11_48775 [Myxococcota bacterium]
MGGFVIACLCAPACVDEGAGDEGNAGATQTSPGGSPGAGDSPAVDCMPRCTDKATECGAPAELADETCRGLCGQDPTEEQAQCLEDSDCHDLTVALGGGTVCEIGQGGGSTTAPGPSDCGNGTCERGESLSNCPSDCEEEPGGTLGDRCDCGEPTFECEGTENGCQFSLSGTSYRCLVNSAERSTGVCTLSCDPNEDRCPEGTCTPLEHHLTQETFYRCE